MTTTDWNQSNHTDYGAADSLGSGPAAPRAKRRTSGTPNYPAGSVFSRPEIRALVADVVQAKVVELSQSLEFGAAFMVNQLDSVVNELTGQA